jgi:retron-type reverse transcriptase
MQSAETVLSVLRERGRRGLPLNELYRQLFNPQLYLLAYGRIYANKGAMTPGASGETADGMSLGKIGRIIDALRHERYRFSPVKRVYIPKKSGEPRPLGLPPWSDKLVGEVVRLLLEAYYEPQFSGRSHGFVPGGAATQHCLKWQTPGPGRPGSSRVTSLTASGASTTKQWPGSWRRRSTIAGSCG